MREVLALLRSAWLAAASYRIGMVLSIAALIITVIPIFFVSNALQPVVAGSISGESDRYFSFIILGLGTLTVITSAMSTLPAALGGSIGSGTFEALMATPTPIPRILAGLSAYAVGWSLVRAMLLLIGAGVVGMQVWWLNLPAAALVMGMLIVVYFTVGLVAAALILYFRTSGPVVAGAITVSALLGGVYYSTTVIPSWLQDLSGFVPLTYGLRAMRKLLLTGAGWGEVQMDVLVLAAMMIVALAISGWFFAVALRHSRRAGTLAQY